MWHVVALMPVPTAPPHKSHRTPRPEPNRQGSAGSPLASSARHPGVPHGRDRGLRHQADASRGQVPKSAEPVAGCHQPESPPHLGPVSTGPDMRSRYEQALAEVEEMKRTLREHARNVAAREKELEQQRLELAGRQGRRRGSASPASSSSPSPSSSIVDEAEKKTELD